MTQAEPFGVALDRIPAPVEPVEARAERVRPRLFESVTRTKASDGTVLGLTALLYAVALATGLWMALDVARGLAIAERCDGKCVESSR